MDYFDYTRDGLAMRFHLAYECATGVQLSVAEQHHADGSFTLEAPEVTYDHCVAP